MNKIEKIKELTDLCNKYREAYYNYQPLVTDEVYDRYFDELLKLEQETNFYLGNSPTQSVGYKVVDSLSKVHHNIPLLSLAKTKSIEDIVKFINNKDVLFMVKGDGLTTKLVYKSYDGISAELIEASTRGDGYDGTLITHNAKTFNIPLKVNYGKDFTVVGESVILKDELNRINSTLPKEKRYANCRNLASGTLSLLDSKECAKRHIHFMAFDIIEGMEEINSLYDRFQILSNFGFEVIYHIKAGNVDIEETNEIIQTIHKYADDNNIPCDGVVVRYDNYSYGTSLGRTNHHYNYGIAKKEEDNFVETIFKNIEWNTSRNGMVVPIGVFNEVNILGSNVSRATLHNLTYIENLNLKKGDRICVSKRNMIIPAIEVNLDYSAKSNTYKLPTHCPACGAELEIKISATGTKNLYCNNPDCHAKFINKLIHYVSRSAMNIEGISEAIIEVLYQKGFVKNYSDLYKLSDYKSELIGMNGFGEKSYNNLINAIEKSKYTTLDRFIVAMGIPNVGKSAAKLIAKKFKGDINNFISETAKGFDYTSIETFGEVINSSIHKWLKDFDKTELIALKNVLIFDTTPFEVKDIKKNPFSGKIIVPTGKLNSFTRDSINAKIESLGAKAASSVSKKTDFVLTNEASGSSKYKKAMELGIPVISEEQFLQMIGE